MTTSKQVLGWTAPKIRDPGAADWWTWLIIACHTQLRLARDLAADLRRPWERPAPPGRLTPAPRRDFRNIRAITGCPAGRCAKTRQALPRAATRLQKPPPGRTARRGQAPRTRHGKAGQQETDGLNGKLTGNVGSSRAGGGPRPGASRGLRAGGPGSGGGWVLAEERGDVVVADAEGAELADVVADLAVAVDLGVVEVGAEVVVPC